MMIVLMFKNFNVMSNFLKVLIKIVDFLSLLLPFLSKVTKEEEKKKKDEEKDNINFDDVN